MKRMIGKLAIAAGLLAMAVAVVAPASAQRSGEPRGRPGGQSGGQSFDIGYIESLRVDHAQNHLRVNGFTRARSIGLDGRQWDLWFNRDFREACAGFTSYNGTVTSVRFFTDSECGVGAAPTRGRDLRPAELEGLRVDDAQRRLRLSDFAPARSVSQNGRQWDLWQNPRARTACVGFTSYNGQVTRADGFSDRDCAGRGEGRPDRGPDRPGSGWGRVEPQDLIRLRVGEGQDWLSRAGYVRARSIEINGRQWDLWSSDRDRSSCIGFTSWNGSITDADDFRESSCRR